MPYWSKIALVGGSVCIAIRISANAAYSASATGPPAATSAPQTATAAKTRATHLDLPLVVDGQVIDQIPSLLTEDLSNPRFAAKRLTGAIATVIRPETLAALTAAADPDGMLSLEALREAGFGARLDKAELVLVLEIPAELKRVSVVDVTGRQPTLQSRQALAPADVSSYVNIRSGLDYLHEGSSTETPGLQPLNLALDGAMNVHGNSLNASLQYLESSGPRVQRGDVSLIHDDPERAIRYQLGDLSYPLAGFQSFQPMGGVTIARNFQLQPYLVTQPVGNQEFMLKQNSRVEVFVNGMRNETIRLPAGRYDMQNFPFTQGLNDVQLRITDDVGRVSVINQPFFFSTDLLRSGLQEYAYSIGEPSSDSNGNRSYAKSFPPFSAFHRIGVSDAITVGANFQGNNIQQTGGGEFTVASSLGTLRADLAGSRDHDLPGGAARLLYTYVDATTPSRVDGDFFNGQYRSFSALATYRTQNFTTLGMAGQNPVALDLSANYTQMLPYGVIAGISAGYQFARTGQHDGFSTGLSFRRSITERMTVDTQLTRSVDTSGHQELRAFVSFTLSLDRSGQTYQTSYDTRDHTAQATWEIAPSYMVGEPYGNVSVSHGHTDDAVSGMVGYNGNRVETTFTHDENLPRGINGASSERRSNLTFGSALVFADGHVGVSRPVTDSFAIVVPAAGLKDHKIGINPVGEHGEHYEAQADMLGPAVVPNLTAYTISSLVVAAPDLPLGLELGQDVFQTQPSFHSGTVVKIGSDATAMIDGVLIGEDGKPLPLIAGNAVAVRDGAAPHEFFTNRKGRFRIDGVKPGTYTLTFNDLPGVALKVTIPDGTVGVYAVGNLQLPAGEVGR